MRLKRFSCNTVQLRLHGCSLLVCLVLDACDPFSYRSRFGPLGPIGDLERLHSRQRVVFVLGLPDLSHGGLRTGVRRFGQAVENVRRFVKLMPA